MHIRIYIWVHTIMSILPALNWHLLKYTTWKPTGIIFSIFIFSANFRRNVSLFNWKRCNNCLMYTIVRNYAWYAHIYLYMLVCIFSHAYTCTYHASFARNSIHERHCTQFAWIKGVKNIQEKPASNNRVWYAHIHVHVYRYVHAYRANTYWWVTYICLYVYTCTHNNLLMALNTIGREISLMKNAIPDRFSTDMYACMQIYFISSHAYMCTYQAKIFLEDNSS